MEKLPLTLRKTRDTKKRVVQGIQGGNAIQSVRIDRDALVDAPPAIIEVTISPQ